MSKEIFSIYHCKACNKIEVSQYVSKQDMEELGLTEEDLRPICPVTGEEDLEELGTMSEEELRQFSFTDVEGIKEYLQGRCVLLS